MPFVSEAQRKFLWAKHPEIAKRWSHKHPESNKGLPIKKQLKKKKSSDAEMAKYLLRTKRR